MKLVELLARELKVWPEGYGFICQDCKDLEFQIAAYRKLPVYTNGEWGHFDGLENGDYEYPVEFNEPATDHATAIVTRADWEAEVARLSAVKPEWIRHRGGKCPVEAGTKVSTRHRDGRVIEVHSVTGDINAGSESLRSIWKHKGDDYDIMAYRICEPEQASEPEQSPRERIKELHALAMAVGMGASVENPLTWRDRISEIDITTEALEEERAGLVQQLEDEGFRLIGKSAVVVDPVVDMSDWRNWKDGDLVECISHEIEWSDKTDIGSICKIDGSPFFDENGLHIFVAGYFMNPADFRWHSRPSA